MGFWSFTYTIQINKIGEELATIVKNGIEVVMDYNPVPEVPGQHRAKYEVGQRFVLGQAEIIGRRPTMEDAFSIVG